MNSLKAKTEFSVYCLLATDSEGRILMKAERLDDVIASVHVQNIHRSLNEDIESLKAFKFINVPMKEIISRLKNFRRLCLSCH